MDAAETWRSLSTGQKFLLIQVGEGRSREGDNLSELRGLHLLQDDLPRMTWLGLQVYSRSGRGK